MHDPTRLFTTVEDRGKPREERVRAARKLAIWCRSGRIPVEEVRRSLEKASALWGELCESRQALSRSLFHDRRDVAFSCLVTSLALPEGQQYFKNMPRHDDVEGPRLGTSESLVRGTFDYTYGSIYEFHHEYPIDGIGVRKDLISVVEPDGTRRPLFDWLHERNVSVWCSRCGLDITHEVSRSCPWREMRRKASPEEA